MAEQGPAHHMDDQEMAEPGPSHPMNDQGEELQASNDTNSELMALRRRIAELEREAVQRERVTANPSPSWHMQPVTVNVKAPVPAPRLGIFTGRNPTGGGELAFKDWLEKTQNYLVEFPDEEENLRRVQASLRGLAREQVRHCQTSADILKTLKGLHGSVQTQEDLYMQFTKIQMKKGEPPLDFFSRVWEKFVLLNSESQYTAEEANRKVFHTFHVNIKDSHPLLAMELRNNFGLPGVASPDLSQIMRRMREVEGSSGNPKATSAAATVSTTQAGQQSTLPAPEIDYNKLADLVVQKMRAEERRQPPPRGGQQVRPKGPCFRCGEMNSHFARDCTNPPNPEKVACERKRMRQGNATQSAWRGGR